MKVKNRNVFNNIKIIFVFFEKIVELPSGGFCQTTKKRRKKSKNTKNFLFLFSLFELLLNLKKRKNEVNTIIKNIQYKIYMQRK